MPRPKAEDVIAAIARIAADPSAPNNNVRPLKGIPNGFRIRIGDWRASYTVDRAAAVIDVFEIAPRGGAYRMSGRKIRFLGELEGSLSAQAIAVALDARCVDEAGDADLVVMRPKHLEEMLEDAAAAAAFHATRGQEAFPAEVVSRLVAGENAVRVWREYRGLSQRALAERAGLNFTYLSQIERGARTGAVKTVRKLSEVLGLELSDLV